MMRINDRVLCWRGARAAGRRSRDGRVAGGQKPGQVAGRRCTDK